MMDEDGIVLALARASELRTKITNCMHRSSTRLTVNKQQEGQERENEDNGSRPEVSEAEDDVEYDDDDDEEAESLFNIHDALESLEGQLSSLQALQLQQWYEREAALAEIDHSRKKLLKKLKECKGKDLQVIHEATAFASETVEDNNDLLLPPYPSRLPCSSLISDNGYLTHLSAPGKVAQNGVTMCDPTNDGKISIHQSEKNQSQCKAQKPPKALRYLISAATKTVVMLVGVVSVLHLTGFEPRLRKRDAEFNPFGLFQHQETGGERKMVQCPPGKVLVVEDGETRCIVKERVEIPFESIVATPDVNFGCG